jgi:hypothetical protein
MDWNNLIYGASWWLALMIIAATIRRRERAAMAYIGNGRLRR